MFTIATLIIRIPIERIIRHQAIGQECRCLGGGGRHGEHDGEAAERLGEAVFPAADWIHEMQSAGGSVWLDGRRTGHQRSAGCGQPLNAGGCAFPSGFRQRRLTGPCFMKPFDAYIPWL